MSQTDNTFDPIIQPASDTAVLPVHLDLECGNLGDHQKVVGIDSVSIFGFADTMPGEPLYDSAFNVCKALAETGYIVVDGGGPGVMQAATMGAKAGGGKSIGVTFYPKEMTKFEGKAFENVVDEEIVTKNYVERTIRLLERGHVYVVFNGGTGTISEFGMAWGLARLYFGHHKPLILYGDFWDEIIAAFYKNMNLRSEDLQVFKIANSPHDVLKAVYEFGNEMKSGLHKHLDINNDGEGAFTL